MRRPSDRYVRNGSRRGRSYRRGAPRAATRRPTRRARLALLAVATTLGMLSLAARCVHLQVIKASALLDVARSQHEKTIILDPRRGPILDRNGRELALSLDVDSIYADPCKIKDSAGVARRLAPLVGLSRSDLRQRLEGRRHFAWIKRKIDPDLRERVEALDLPGIRFVRESRRYYPKKNLASHILGACGVDNQGLAGLEFAFDETIKGTPGRILFLRDGRGDRVLDRSRLEPTPGTGLRLTIDVTIQHIAERELEAAMAATSARGAAVVVIEPRSGEILALASRPTFDPHRYPTAASEARRNRAVTDFYEPGSVFKVITAAAALDAGRVHPDETIWCENGSIVVARHRFKEDHLPFGNLTLTEVLARSSNVGAIKIGGRLAPQEFLDAIRRFGFGRKTGLELTGESPGLVRNVDDWSGLSQASISLGQEIGTTPVQLAAAVAAIANDGVWNRPHVVKEMLPADGRSFVPAPGRDRPRSRRSISTDTARSLRRMLESVTLDGTGRAAAIPGYSVGGKTGTAQKIDESGRYSRSKHVAWFAGFVPVERPALVIVVMVDEPQGRRYHGGHVAAPVFARIAGPVLQYLGVPPDREATLVFDRSARTARGAGRGRPAVARAVTAMRPGGHRNGGVARGAGAPMAGRAVQASLSGVSVATMPDLDGMSLRQASETLAALGLACTTRRGGASVARQEPDPGTSLPAHGLCSVTY